jgi:hypothetical protein
MYQILPSCAAVIASLTYSANKFLSPLKRISSAMLYHFDSNEERANKDEIVKKRLETFQLEEKRKLEERKREEQEFVVNEAVSVALELNTVLDPTVAPDRLSDVIAHAIPRVITPAEEVCMHTWKFIYTCIYNMKTLLLTMYIFCLSIYFRTAKLFRVLLCLLLLLFFDIYNNFCQKCICI